MKLGEVVLYLKAQAQVAHACGQLTTHALLIQMADVVEEQSRASHAERIPIVDIQARLSVRAERAVREVQKRFHITTLGELAGCTDQLLAVRGCGTTCVREIAREMSRFGLHLVHFEGQYENGKCTK